MAELKKTVANLNPEVKTIDEPVASAFFEGIKLSFEKIVEFEASLRERIKETEKLEFTAENASVELALGAQKAELRKILGEEVT